VRLTDHLSKALLEEFNARLAQRQRTGDDFARVLLQRLVLDEMVADRERELRHALDAVQFSEVDGPLKASPALITLLNHPAELALLRAALSA
jgi:hypothetical protein